MSTDVVAEIDRLIGGGAEADDVLRAVVAMLAAAPGVLWAGIYFLDRGTLVLGPEAGTADPLQRIGIPVSYDGVTVGELAIDGTVDATTAEEIAGRISAHVLLGWDTGGVPWEP